MKENERLVEMWKIGENRRKSRRIKRKSKKRTFCLPGWNMKSIKMRGTSVGLYTSRQGFEASLFGIQCSVFSARSRLEKIAVRQTDRRSNRLAFVILLSLDASCWLDRDRVGTNLPSRPRIARILSLRRKGLLFTIAKTNMIKPLKYQLSRNKRNSLLISQPT